MAHGNAIRRHYFNSKDRLPVITKERRSWKEKPLSAAERLKSNLTSIQTFPLSVVKLSNTT